MSRLVLPNGVTALVQRDGSAPVVAVVTHVRAGYFDEPDAWSGIAHVLEHMYFKGTARRGPGTIARETQEVGGYVNAGTIYDKTVYYTVLPAAAGGLERALDIHSDALMHAAIDPDELGRELKVIIQEAKRKLDTPPAVTAETLYELLFDRHRMRRWRIGTEDGLRRLTATDVRQYYESRYTPDRVIVGVVGDVDPDAVLRLIEAYFGSWSRPAATVEGSPVETDERRAQLRVLSRDVERPLASLGWRTVGALHADAPALEVAATILGSGRGAHLYQALRVPGTAASTGAFHYTPTEVGVFEVDLEADADRMADAVQQATALVMALGARGPAAEDLRRARALLATGWARRLESMDGRATALCAAEALGGYRLLDTLATQTLAVGSTDVQGAVQTWLGHEALNGVMCVPQGSESRFDRPWPPSVRDVAHRSQTPPKVPASAEAVAAPEPTRLPEGLLRWECPGLDLLVKHKPGSHSVTLLLHFPGVPLREQATTAGLSWLLARSAVRGAGGMRGEQLALAAEMLGGAIAPAVSAETLGWSITVDPSGLAAAAQLLQTVARAAQLDPDEVQVERALQMSDARRARDDMFRYPLQRVMAVAFPDHPYGLPSLGDPEMLAHLGADQVQEWARAVHAVRPVAVVVGDVTPPAAFEALGSLPGGDVVSEPPWSERSNPKWEAGARSEERRKQQSALALAFPAPPSTSADRYAVSVVGALLSGMAGRLFDELRERRSLAYTVAAMPWFAREAGAMLCYIATSPEREAEARSAMLTELRRLSDDPPTEAELTRARNYTAGIVEIGKQSGRSLAATILEAWRRGSIEEWADGPDRLREVALDDVLRVAAGVFQLDRVAEFVVRGERPVGR